MNWLSKILEALWWKPATPPKREEEHLATYQEVFEQSPNCGGKIKPRFIILHHSDGSFIGGVSWIKMARSQVSYHYLINSDGGRVQFVHDSRKAWHAGKSKWQDYIGLNSHSIGIALWGNTNKRTPAFAEIDSCAEKCIYLMNKFAIPIENILSHKQIAPNRKNDPSDNVMYRVILRIKERQAIN